MWSAGTTYTTPPLRLSLQGTRHHLINFIPKLLAATPQKRLRIYLTLLKVIAHKVVPDRPGRSEPNTFRLSPNPNTSRLSPKLVKLAVIIP